jgi:hypothetical protein
MKAWPSNTTPGCGAQKFELVFSGIQKNEFRRIQKNSEEFRQNI